MLFDLLLQSWPHDNQAQPKDVGNALPTAPHGTDADGMAHAHCKSHGQDDWRDGP